MPSVIHAFLLKPVHAFFMSHSTRDRRLSGGGLSSRITRRAASRHCWTALIALALIHAVSGREVDYSAMSPTVRIRAYQRTPGGHPAMTGMGSGTLISADGLVLTNHHVIYDSLRKKPLPLFDVGITFDKKKRPVAQYLARLVAADKEKDVAILKLLPQTVFGEPLPPLKHLTWDREFTLHPGDRMRVAGYAASGGETLTLTQGQVSGFEKFREMTVFKTDTDIDNGSSGGTVLDKDGQFIGVPVYLRSYRENVGYILDLRALRPWIRTAVTEAPGGKDGAEDRLAFRLRQFVEAEDTGVVTTGMYPEARLTFEKPWELLHYDVDTFALLQREISTPVGVRVSVIHCLYPLNDAFKEQTLKEVRQFEKKANHFNEEDVDIAGKPGKLFKVSVDAQRHIQYYVWLDDCYLFINARLDIREESVAARQWAAVRDLVNGLSFPEPGAYPQPYLEGKVDFPLTGVSVEIPPDWRGLAATNGDDRTGIVTLGIETRRDASINIFRGFVPEHQRDKTVDDQIRDILDNTSRDVKIIRRNDAAVVDGLPAFYLLFEEDEKDKEFQSLLLQVLMGDHVLNIIARDLAENAEALMRDVAAMLPTVRLENGPDRDRGVCEIGHLSSLFSDVRHHVYEEEIVLLAARDVLPGFPDGTFRPEAPVTRERALKIIINARKASDHANRSANGMTLDLAAGKASPFRDIRADDPLTPYLIKADELGALDFIPAKPFTGRRFGPDRNVTAIQALAMVTAIFDIDVYEGEGVNRQKSLADYGAVSGLLPDTVKNPKQPLTAAELAAMAAFGFYHNEE
ncbi:MAG: trypsin-like peptidase domain-containing protein [Lentisphaeria bacterium]|nr:trypsin-like peptidase domain-containing protein [Lentisphaeria bacterium]